MVSGMGVFSGCVCVVEGYGLELMAFYMFTCLVLKSMLSMNLGTSQRALGDAIYRAGASGTFLGVI